MVAPFFFLTLNLLASLACSCDVAPPVLATMKIFLQQVKDVVAELALVGRKQGVMTFDVLLDCRCVDDVGLFSFVLSDRAVLAVIAMFPLSFADAH